jgi:hypothetical protein
MIHIFKKGLYLSIKSSMEFNTFQISFLQDKFSKLKQAASTRSIDFCRGTSTRSRDFMALSNEDDIRRAAPNFLLGRRLEEEDSDDDDDDDWMDACDGKEVFMYAYICIHIYIYVHR